MWRFGSGIVVSCWRLWQGPVEEPEQLGSSPMNPAVPSGSVPAAAIVPAAVVKSVVAPKQICCALSTLLALPLTPIGVLILIDTTFAAPTVVNVSYVFGSAVLYPPYWAPAHESWVPFTL